MRNLGLLGTYVSLLFQQHVVLADIHAGGRLIDGSLRQYDSTRHLTPESLLLLKLKNKYGENIDYTPFFTA